MLPVNSGGHAAYQNFVIEYYFLNYLRCCQTNVVVDFLFPQWPPPLADMTNIGRQKNFPI